MLTNPRLRLGVTLWLGAMAGVIVLCLTVVPQLLESAAKKIPLWAAIAATVAQSSVLLMLAVWAGVALSRSLGLAAPAIEAALSGSGGWAALKTQRLPALVVGVLTGAWLLLLSQIAPAELAARGQTMHIPIIAKLLYGGVTEEILLRWGVMTGLLWLLWRFIQQKAGAPRTAYIVTAILLSALLFGAGHLPAVASMGIGLTAPVVAFIIVGNTLPAALFGWLYWRKGLEAAILAHALAHTVATLLAAT